MAARRVAASLAWLVCLYSAGMLAFAVLDPQPSRGFGIVALVYFALTTSAVSGVLALGLAFLDHRRTGKLAMARGMGVAALVAFVAVLGGLGVPSALEYVRSRPPALHAACAAGDARRVGALLDEGAPLDQRDHAGRTPAVVAAQRSSVAVLEVLVAHGARLDDAALVPAAVRNGDRGVLTWLLAHGAPAGGQGGAALDTAACLPDAEAVRALVAAGAPAEPGFRAASLCGQWQLFALLPVSDAARASALFDAITQGQYGSATALLEGGVSPDVARRAEGSDTDERPLAVAIERQNLPMVDLLLDHHARLDVSVRAALWPLALAIEQNERPLVAHLLSRGAALPDRAFGDEVARDGAEVVARRLLDPREDEEE